MLSRRTLIGSLISLVAAPAIVRVSRIMPVKVIEPDIYAELARYSLYDDARIRTIYRGYEYWCSGTDSVMHWRKVENRELWTHG